MMTATTLPTTMPAIAPPLNPDGSESPELSSPEGVVLDGGDVVAVPPVALDSGPGSELTVFGSNVLKI